jgi:hypothetical protein
MLMSAVESWPERIPVNGEVDFTMMYAAHDAFTRDLGRLAAASAGGALSDETLQTWSTFAHQLHVHHTVEDEALWPRLRDAVRAGSEVEVLDAMELEHAQIEPELEHVEAAVADRDARRFHQHVLTLARSLGTHMRHEENAALPLVDKYLGRAGWAAFGRHIRSTQGGIRGGAEYLPWVLDGASDDMTRQVLRQLPPPARLLYRRVWSPPYAARPTSRIS